MNDTSNLDPSLPPLTPHSIGAELLINCSNVDPNGTYFNENNCSFVLLSHLVGAPPWWIQLIVQILYGIVCCVGLCGNSLVIYVVVRFSKMQTVTNLYIVNLAIADECFLVGIPFLMTTMGLGYWPFGNILCKAYFTSTSINQITSSMFLLIMSADRYLAVCHPVRATKYRTPLIAKIVALTAWTLSALIMVPIYMYANTLEIDNKINCNIFWPSSETWTGEAIFIVYSFIISFAVPLILIMIFYVLVILKLKTIGPKRRPVPTPSSSSNPNATLSSTETRRKSSTTGTDQQQGPGPGPYITPQQASRARDRKKSHRKVTKLVLTVITVYFICWAPYWITQMALIYKPSEARHSNTMLIVYLLAGCFSYSNSTMNPILYAFLSDNFKKSFLKACTCAKGQDVNAKLHVENSIFPKGKKSEKGGKGKGVSTSGDTNKSGSASGVVKVVTTSIHMNPNNLTREGGGKSLLQVPSRLPYEDEDTESGESEDDEGIGGSGGSGTGYNGTGLGLGINKGLLSVTRISNNTPSTSTSGGVHSSTSDNTQSTFLQDGVHVTTL